jgi:GMP synthase (glutamine-hydrolysing)
MHRENKVWALMHVSHEDLGSFEFILRSFGIRPVPIMAGQADIAALDPDEPDLVIIMGGPMGVYEANQHPHLHQEIRFAERRIALNKPILGVCLGAQIIAKALGSKVFRGPQGKEIGWNPVSINAEGMRTPLKYLDQSECVCAHWHGDTFDLPRGSKLLASSDRYQNQAFSYGDNVLGLQFHPEVTEVKLERWYARLISDIVEAGKSVESLRAEAHRYGDTLKAQNRLFFTDWLGQVAPQLLAHSHQPAVDVA